MTCSKFRRDGIWFGQSAGEKPFPFRLQLDQKKKEPRRRDAGGATVLAQSRGSQRTMWVVPSSAGVSRLTRRQRSQLGPNSGAPILRFT